MVEYIFIYQCNVCETYSGAILRIYNMTEMEGDLYEKLLEMKNHVKPHCRECNNSTTFTDIRITLFNEGMKEIENYNKELQLR